jgi:anti-sigma B factor antagonist
MSLIVQIKPKEKGSYLISLAGRLDSETYAACEEKLMPLLPTARVLIFDLAQLVYISSMGLRVMLKIKKTMELNCGQVIITQLQPQIAKVFEIARALPNTAVFASIQEADAYLDAMQKQEIEKHQQL